MIFFGNKIDFFWTQNCALNVVSTILASSRHPPPPHLTVDPWPCMGRCDMSRRLFFRILRPAAAARLLGAPGRVQESWAWQFRGNLHFFCCCFVIFQVCTAFVFSCNFTCIIHTAKLFQSSSFFFPELFSWLEQSEPRDQPLYSTVLFWDKRKQGFFKCNWQLSYHLVDERYINTLVGQILVGYSD
jgi:hypothetical protein